MTAAEYDPSNIVRGSPETYGNDNERMLLDYAYSDDLARKRGPLSAFLRKFASAFGHVPRNASLRHSIVAAASVYLSPGSFSQFEYHIKLAIRTLELKIKTPANIVDEDAVSAAVAVWAMGASDSATPNCKSIINVFLTTFRHLSERGASGSSGIFPTISAVLFDSVKYCASSRPRTMWHHWWRSQTNGRLLNFKDRRHHLSELDRLVANKSDTSLLDATIVTIDDCLQTVWSFLCNEVQTIVPTWKSPKIAKSVYDGVSKTFNDADFRSAWYLLQNKSETTVQPSIRHLLLLSYAIIGKKALDCVFAILKASSVMSGLSALEQSFATRDLIYACLEPTLWQTDDVSIAWFRIIDIYRIALVLGSCTISERHSDRKLPYPSSDLVLIPSQLDRQCSERCG